MNMSASRWGGLAMVLLTATLGWSQQPFRLAVPGGGAESRAELTPSSLVVDSAGGRTVYQRSRRDDTADGRWLGFRNAAIGQVLRWPRSNQGNFQIGTVGAGGITTFRTSAMQILPSLRPGAGTLPPTGPQPLAGEFRLSSFESMPLSMALDIAVGRQAAMVAAAPARERVWSIRDVGRGYYRIQTVLGGRAFSLASLPGTTNVDVVPVARAANQLWMIRPNPIDGSLSIENAAIPGRVLSGGRDGIVSLERISNVDAQRWRAVAMGPAAGFRPAMRTVSHDVRPNPPLQAQRIELKNRHKNELWVLIQDRRPGGPKNRIKIPSGGSVQLDFDWDPGATVVESVELLTAGGLYERQEFVTPLPPVPYYDLSVYEQMLQSITVDRRGNNPQPIQEVNYSPKSVGWFILPPAEVIRDGTLDVYTLALEANNPGGVRRLDPKLWGLGQPKKDPLQEILDEAR